MKLCLGVVLACLATANAMYSASDDVIELTPSNFNNEVTQSGDLWFVEFYAPWCGHCKSLAPEWKKAATALKGIVNIGAVNADEHNSLGGQYGVKGFPTIKVFSANKNSPSDYQGARTAQGIVDNAMQELKTLVNARMSGKAGGGSSRGGSSGGSGGGGGKADPKDLITLTDANFDAEVMKSQDLWLVEFYAPWCGHCKTLAPHWAQAASDLKGKVKVAQVDATENQNLAQRYGVRGYPTIKVFPAGAKPGEVADYDGGRTAADIVAWALDKVADNIPAPELIELTDDSVMKAACEEHQLCVIAILPHILDCPSKCRNDYLKTLTKMGDKHKKKMWGWVWAEGMAQPGVEESLGIGGFGYPAMAIINAKKMKFALLKGSFSDTGINEFVREVGYGKGSTQTIKKAELPTIETRESWDGKDGELPEEEEIDLSDVFLDDLDDEDTKKDEL